MDYVKAQALALRLITKYGRSITFQELSATPADSSKPWRGAGVPTVANTSPQKGAFVPHASVEDLGLLTSDEELLKKSEQVCLVAGGATDLEAYTVILDGGVRWAIQWVRTLKPGGTVVLYAFGVKR